MIPPLLLVFAFAFAISSVAAAYLCVIIFLRSADDISLAGMGAWLSILFGAIAFVFLGLWLIVDVLPAHLRR